MKSVDARIWDSNSQDHLEIFRMENNWMRYMYVHMALSNLGRFGLRSLMKRSTGRGDST